MSTSDLTSLPQGTRVRIALKGVERALECLTGPAYNLDTMPAVVVTRMADGAEMAVSLHTVVRVEVLDSDERVIAGFERLIGAASSVAEREGLYRALDAFCGEASAEVEGEEETPDFWTLVESAPVWAAATADLFHWSTNYDFGRSPAALFLDLIGYSVDEFGEALYVAEHGDYGLGFTEAGKLAGALTEWADRPGDVRDFAAALFGGAK